jgi:hypothetical protein
VSESGFSDIQLFTRRYARGELKGEELDRFEDYLMEHPELLDEIEAEGVLRQAMTAEVVPLRPRSSARARSAPTFQPWAAAACLVVALGVGFYSAGLVQQTPGAAISAELRLEPVRSGGGALPSTLRGDHTLFILDVGLQAAQIDRVVISRSSGEELLQLDNPSVIDGYVQFTLGDLDADSYRVAVYTAPGAAAAVSYGFTVRER